MSEGRMRDRNEGLWARLKRFALTDVGALMRGLNAEDLEKMEQVLIEADFGVPATIELTQALEDEVRKGKLKTEDDLRRALEGRLASLLDGSENPGVLARNPGGPTVILLIGVNGTGKTTTVGKLALALAEEGKQPVLAAADTFRAAATEQLVIWGDRVGAPVVRHQQGADPAAVAFDGLASARARGADVLLVDTAGRLHTKTNLMEELRKVRRVADRDPGNVTEVLLVLDATTGQNALSQVDAFLKTAGVTGPGMTNIATAMGQAYADSIPMLVISAVNALGQIVLEDRA